jgi:hypothetical protein
LRLGIGKKNEGSESKLPLRWFDELEPAYFAPKDPRRDRWGEERESAFGGVREVGRGRSFAVARLVPLFDAPPRAKPIR